MLYFVLSIINLCHPQLQSKILTLHMLSFSIPLFANFVTGAMMKSKDGSDNILQQLNNPLLAGIPKALSSVILDFQNSVGSTYNQSKDIYKKRNRREDDKSIYSFPSFQNR